MRDRQLPLNYLEDKGNKNVAVSEITADEVLGTNIPNEKIFFSFESRFEPYGYLVHDSLKLIDLVCRESRDGRALTPLEIKLTTIPDSTTFDKKEIDYGSELVVRNPTTRYMALSMVHSCQRKMRKIRNLFEPLCHSIRSWDNAAEVLTKREQIMETLNQFLDDFKHFQKPLLMQPIWKTVGRSAELAENCLDIFIWSNFSLARLIMDAAKERRTEITRPQRAAIRLARFLYEASTRKRVYQGPIYDGMTYNTLNDKEFAIAGNRTNEFMRCKRLETPAVEKDEIKHIIRGGGQNFLSPERRFDSIIFLLNRFI